MATTKVTRLDHYPAENPIGWAVGFTVTTDNNRSFYRDTVIPFTDTSHDNLAIDLALTGGDDYELCFTVPSHISQSNLKKMITTIKVFQIGRINEFSLKLNLIDDDEKLYKLKSTGYRHF